MTSTHTLFTDHRTPRAWLSKPVDPSLLEALYNLLKWGPTGTNCNPMRVVFVCSPQAKETLLPCLDAGNVEKTRQAPVTAIVAYDHAFYEKLPTLFAHTDARSWFEGNEALIKDTAFRNSSLQGAYLILAARMLGLDAGPMSGFNADKVKEAFMPNKPWTPNFLCNLGYGDFSHIHPRLPRLSFEEACNIV
jgi:3-hydroxypropanoate dehydrogenase